MRYLHPRSAPPKTSPTPRQCVILAFITDFYAANHYSPSMREIAAGCGVASTSMVNSDLDQLQALGYLTTQPGKSRTIVLVGATWTPPPNGAE